MIELNPVLLPKAISAQQGKLIYNKSKDTIEYIKFKEQASGRVHIVVWLIIQISRAMRSDSLLFEVPRVDITKIEFKEATTFKYGEINITARDKTYKIKFGKDTLDEECLNAFLDLFGDKVSKIVLS